jgi:uncharacterized SAM-binding protein YcdF (DUF218 family)
MRWPIWILAGGVGAVVATFALLLFSASEIYEFPRDTGRASWQEVDVIVALAGGRGRIAYAAKLWDEARLVREGRAPPVLYLSGVGPRVEIDSLKDQGISPETLSHLNQDSVVLERVSENTFENAQIFSSFAKQQAWKKIVVVTAPYHMKRALYVLDESLDSSFTLYSYPSPVELFHEDEWRRSVDGLFVTFLEYIKWVIYRALY